MDNSKMKKLVSFYLAAFFIFLAAAASAACTDLTKGSSFSLTREKPRFVVVNTVSADGTVVEEREMTRNGSTELVTTTYWNGVVPVDRISSSSHIQLKLSTKIKRVDLNRVGKSHRFPVSIFINGNEVDRGSFVIEPIKKSTLSVGKCQYSVMVVRTTLNRNNGYPINEEALLSVDAGMMLGNTAMTADWRPKHGVFFDAINAN